MVNAEQPNSVGELARSTAAHACSHRPCIAFGALLNPIGRPAAHAWVELILLNQECNLRALQRVKPLF
jgi:hypothetical protein